MDIMIFQSPEISEIQIASGPSTSDKEYLTFFTDYLRLGNLQRKKKGLFWLKDLEFGKPKIRWPHVVTFW
jgi:hypothetical protein